MPVALLLALAAAAPAVSVAPPQARPGDAVLVRVLDAREQPAGEVAGRPLAFWREGDEWRALGALPLELGPGTVPVSVAADGARAEAALAIVEPGFESRTLHVAPRFVEPPPAVRRRIEADRRAFAAAYARPPAPPRFLSGFTWPRESRVTGRFGDQRVFNERKQSVHYGLDLGGSRGAPVQAAADGEVVLARDAYLSGKSVVLWHGSDVFTLYFHLDRMLVRPGAKVRKGERIGRVGSTGRSTGPHLHWSARVGGLLVDPESLVGIDFAAGTAPPRTTRAPPAPAPPPPSDAPVEAPAPAPEGREDAPHQAPPPPEAQEPSEEPPR
jgi:murein DD-endopeptidase MepM/ murein hydrolase activator NlpD